jgi:hypothetical protein
MIIIQMHFSFASKERCSGRGNKNCNLSWNQAADLKQYVTVY